MELFNGTADCESTGSLGSDPRMVELVAEWAARPPERRDEILKELLMADMDEQLRRAICNSGETYYALAKRTGVDAVVISRFVAGERSLRLDTAAKLAEALDLELRPRKRTAK